MGNTLITDKGLTHLNGLEFLDSLSLDGTAVSDAGLSNLQDLPALKTLNLEGTEVTEKGIEALKIRFPELKTTR